MQKSTYTPASVEVMTFSKDNIIVATSDDPETEGEQQPG